MTAWLHCLLGVAVLVTGTSTASYQRQLLVDLLKYYNTNERPMNLINQQPLEVRLSVQLQKVIDVDLSVGEMKTSVWLSMTWSDYNLAWTPARYHNISSINLPAEQIWTPDMKFFNGITPEKVEQTLTFVSASGRVMLVQPRSLSTVCQASGFLYPFESISCPLVVGSWTHDARNIDIKVDKSTLGETGDVGTWQVKNIESEKVVKVYDCCPQPYSSAAVTLHLRRRSTLLHLFRIHIPLIWVVIVSLLTFCIPCERVEIRIVAGILLVCGAGWFQSSAHLPSYFTVTHIFCANMIVALSLSIAINCLQMALQENSMPQGMTQALRIHLGKALASDFALKIAMISKAEIEGPPRDKTGPAAIAQFLDRIGINLVAFIVLLNLIFCCILPWIAS
ncbi:acetylcholine receptor subunit alpha-type acr-16-like [Galendromus occidentalis]|uniref:Acetylcholine receptor subunit alpha-type acr-16-like n=1 Tax=Galendromus occidentalis TaxID=34638 RepID=A0AAJ6QSA5_9ACAR|nr:acetylcholine receptor subunit alpha-type acr-16-like [Galendromus occidentalis]